MVWFPGLFSRRRTYVHLNVRTSSPWPFLFRTGESLAGFLITNNVIANMSAATKTENVITLKGSVAVVSEFFYCAINSILYQRGE